MTRGDQRERDRLKALKKQQKDGAHPNNKKEKHTKDLVGKKMTDAEIMREKQKAHEALKIEEEKKKYEEEEKKFTKKK